MSATLSENSPSQHRFQKIHTNCKHCCFALRDLIFEPNKEMEDSYWSQVGCKLGMTQKFEQVKPGSVIPAYDNEAEFFIINGRHCPFCRNEEWADAHKDANLEELVRAQAQLKITYIVYFSQNDKEEDLVKTLESIIKQHIPPQKIIILNSVKRMLLDAQHVLNESGIVWGIDHLLENRSEDDWVHTYVNKTPKTQQWFSWAKPGYVYNEKYALEINKRILDDLAIIIAVMPDNGSGGLFNKFVFTGAVGNKGFNFFEKMESLEQEKHFPKVTEIC